MIVKHFSKISLNNLVGYFKFILNQALDKTNEETIKLAREKQLPLLDLFSNLSEEELLALSKEGLKKFLISVLEGTIIETQKETIERWKRDQLDGIPQKRVEVSDIIIINNTRKNIFLKLLTDYTKDPYLIINIARELEELFSLITYITFNNYVEIHDNELRSLNLHLKEYQEELMVINEELQESHEEIQATNEELREQIEIRKEIEEALEKERNFLKSILQEMSDGIIACDEKGVLTYFNNAAKKFYGIPNDSIPSNDWNHHYLLYKNDGITPLKKEEEPLVQTLNGETVKDLELVVDSLDGNKSILCVSGKRLMTIEGKKLGAVIVMQDITDAKAAEALQIELIEQEARAKEATRQEQLMYQLFLEAPAPIALLKGPKLRFALANKEFEKIIVPGKALTGKDLLEVLPELKGTDIYNIIQKVYQTAERFVGNEIPIMLNRGKGLETGYFNFVYEPTFSPSGTCDGVFVFAYEVTELINSRNELQRLTDELAAANEELTAANEEIQASLEDISDTNQKLIRVNNDLDNFVYTASHDLKAPIANIEGLVGALVRNLSPESQTKVEKLIGLIEVSINRFKRTINDLTDVVKLQKEESEAEPIALVKVIEEVQQDLSTTIRESNTKFILERCEDFEIHFSLKNFKSIIYNLVSNAIKYRSPDRQPIVKISCSEDTTYKIIAVEDNGLGIDLRQESKIFSMFKRLHNHVEGSGIGLYIVKKIIENTGGKIEVSSKINEGSVFRVYFKK